MEDKTRKNIKEIVLYAVITYIAVILISGLAWWWFGAHLNFFGEQGTHYDTSVFFTGCYGSFWLICPFVSFAVLLIKRHWKVALGFLVLGALNIFLIFGVGILS